MKRWSTVFLVATLFFLLGNGPSHAGPEAAVLSVNTVADRSQTAGYQAFAESISPSLCLAEQEAAIVPLRPVPMSEEAIDLSPVSQTCSGGGGEGCRIPSVFSQTKKSTTAISPCGDWGPVKWDRNDSEKGTPRLAGSRPTRAPLKVVLKPRGAVVEMEVEAQVD